MKFLTLIFSISLVFLGYSQKEKPQNYRKFDQRILHFGVILGANVSSYTAYQKLEAYSDFGMKAMDINPQPGAQMGLLASIKLGTPIVRLRFLPTLSFQERAIVQRFEDPINLQTDIINEERVNATNLDFPLMFQFRTTRLNNFTSYALLGAQYSYDLQSQQDATQNFNDPFLKMKKHDIAGQVGGGIEFFAVYFKFGIELKYSHSFINGFIQDNTKASNPIQKLYNSGWVFSIIFEG